MCGIFGVKINKISPQLYDNLFYIYKKQEHRGRLGCGVAVNRNGRIFRRRGRESDELFEHTKFIDVWKHLQIGDAVMAHHRWASSGGSGYILTSNHPIMSEDRGFCLIHNGVLYNYYNAYQELLAQGHRFETTIKSKNSEEITDSEILVHMLEGFNTVVGSAHNLSKVAGSIAVAFFKKGSRRLYLYRDGNPIVVYKDADDNIYFSSELHNDGRFIKISELREGSLYAIGTYLECIKKVKDFEKKEIKEDNEDDTQKKVIDYCILPKGKEESFNFNNANVRKVVNDDGTTTYFVR